MDDDDFAARQKACDELERIGSIAELELREAMKETNSAEVRKQAQDLLQTLAGSQLRQRCVSFKPFRFWNTSRMPKRERSLETLAEGEPTAVSVCLERNP